MFENQKVGLACNAFFEAFKAFIPTIEIYNTKCKYDLVIFPGGEDINPNLYNQRNMYSQFDNGRDQKEIQVFQHLTLGSSKTKILGVCRGHQLINVLRGGALIQDIGNEIQTLATNPRYILNKKVKNVLKSRGKNIHPGWHTLVPVTSSEELLKVFPDGVNSYHHQAVVVPGKGLDVLYQFNGIIEVCSSSNILTVQFHPEFMEYRYALPFWKEVELWSAPQEEKPKENPKGKLSTTTTMRYEYKKTGGAEIEW